MENKIVEIGIGEYVSLYTGEPIVSFLKMLEACKIVFNDTIPVDMTKSEMIDFLEKRVAVFNAYNGTTVLAQYVNDFGWPDIDKSQSQEVIHQQSDEYIKAISAKLGKSMVKVDTIDISKYTITKK